VVIAVHGGAGSPRVDAPAAEDPGARAGMTRALEAGHVVLAAGGSALDAVEAAVRVLEDEPRFNSGRGSVLTRDGTVQTDAAIMDGATRRAGAVAAISGVRHPVSLARQVLDEGRHVMLAGLGAERFARDHGLEMVAPDWQITDQQRRLAGRRGGDDPWVTGETVGAVALDRDGRLAAATSTGGLRDKRPGRVGDSPVIGAGTFADERLAVSATGVGEALLRAVTAHECAALVQHAGLSVEEAAPRALAAVGAEAALLVVAADGTVVLPSTAPVFHRGVRRNDGPAWTATRVS